ncbi:MAG: heme o synthase [Actinomycetota bacterium]|jgi:protoheme IX farnesyltransferase|nr:heme o synthase [Actinomycetota bacterium]
MARAVVTGSTSISQEAEAAADIAPASLGARAAAYFALTKPRIIELLLVTTVPPMFVAARGWPPLWVTLATLVGGSLSAGGANAINCYLDRDIDQVMTRTRRRPLPAHKVSPQNALVFGVTLGIVAFIFLWVTVNLLAASLTSVALLFYVGVYTFWLKRRTPQNIVIGGAAGAMPVLVGWAAITGRVSLPALALFAIVFYWTPPHFWALSMRYEKEYAAAGVPMMPVVYGRAETAKHILLYSFLLLAMSLIFFSVARMGLVYLASALVLNGTFIYWAVKVWRDPAPRVAWSLFRFSIYYLALLFAAMAVDELLPLRSILH